MVYNQNSSLETKVPYKEMSNKIILQKYSKNNSKRKKENLKHYEF